MGKGRGEQSPQGLRGPRAITITDVARRAGVSTATVSRTLAKPDRVAETTRTAVFAAIRETGYIPNATARSLRARSTKMVLALLNGIGDSFFTAILNSVEEALFDAGYGLVMGDTRGDTERESHYDRLVRSGQVDGVLLFSGRLPDARFGELDAIVPLTLVCNDIPDLSVPFVESANRDAARVMVEYLIGVGHRRIGHITGPMRGPEADDRLAGYRDALEGAGIAFDPNMIWPGNYRAASGGEAAVQHFLPMTDRPTAVFAANDESAIGFIKAVRDAGLSVPKDVSVAGYDDIGYAALFDPGLTTMHQPRAELGRVAAEILVRRMSGEGSPASRITHLPCTLVERESVAPLADESGQRRKSPVRRPVAIDT
jgi:LacI family repressor for deo operon, udp, cdd, tsx, nupC, and nupG